MAWLGREDPDVAAMHAGYLWVVAGMALAAGAAPPVSLVPADVALHAFTAGAIGTMTMAVMARLAITRGTSAGASAPLAGAAVAMLHVAALLRTAAPVVDEAYVALVSAGAVGWSLAWATMLAALLLGPGRTRWVPGGTGTEPGPGAERPHPDRRHLPRPTVTQLSPTGSIRLRPPARADRLAFDITGRITEPDIAWMAERATEGFDRAGEVDMLVVIHRWEGADLGAMANREMLAAQLRSLRHVRRYAVVGAPTWARTMISLSDPLIPVEARTFDAGDEVGAEAWLQDPPPPR